MSEVVIVWGGECLGGERLTIKLSDFTILMPNCPGVKLCKIVLPLIRGNKYDKM